MRDSVLYVGSNMSEYTRRDLLKLGVAAPAAARALLRGAGGDENPTTHESSTLMQAEKNVKPSPRERISLDFGWRFHLGNADDASKDFQFGESSILGKSGEFFEACRKDFDDSSWREIDLPHDWAVELPFESGEGHSKDVQTTLVDHGCKPLGRDFPATSIGWYRRVFEIPASDLGRRISIEFDGIYRDAIVALNGHYVGRNLSGYAPARYDVTDWLNYGGKNYLVVRVDATENEGWFYEGAGIYRHVWMVKTNAVHFAHDGVFISADIGGQARLARLDIESEVVNQGKSEITCTVSCEWIGSDQNPGAVAGGLAGALRSRSKTIAAGTSTEYGTGVEMVAANLWSLESPYTYRAVMSLLAGDELLDRVEIPFGVRQIKFDVDKGFFLNGKRVAIQGTCNHQDHAGVGAALPDRLQYFRIQKLKEMGCNAIRTSHNPPTPELLDACDKLGMLVMDETRMMDSSEEGLSQLTRMVRRDRNHPCVILWSIGNEEPEQGTQRGARITETMKSVVKKIDPTRPVTAAMNGSWGKGISAVVDVQGFNYKILGSVDKFHEDFPAKPCVGSERSKHGEHARNLRKRQGARIFERLRPEPSGVGIERGRLGAIFRGACVAGGRVCVDRIRLSRRTDSVFVAVHQLAFRNHGYVRVSEGQLFLLSGMVARQICAARFSPLELGRKRGAADKCLGAQQLRRGGIVFERKIAGAKTDDTAFASGMECAVCGWHFAGTRIFGRKTNC